MGPIATTSGSTATAPPSNLDGHSCPGLPLLTMASTSCDCTPFGEADTESIESSDKCDVEGGKHCLHKRKLVCEVILLSMTIGVVWSLMLLPIIFWHLPVNIAVQMVSLHSYY